MKSLLRHGLLLAILCTIFAGCSETKEPKPLTYTQLLTGETQKTWRLVSYQIFDEGKGQGVVNVQNSIDPCRADDQYIFYANEEHKASFSNGATKCGANEPATIDDTWTLINANATLEFLFPFLADEKLPYTIRNLTETAMTIEIYFGADINASYRFTFNSTTK